MFNLVLLVFGVFSCSTSALMIKASQLHPALISAHRLLLAALLLSPLYFRMHRKYREQYSLAQLKLVLLPALTLALHLVTWAQGVKLTHAANASLIVNMVPVAMPVMLFLLEREIINAKEATGTLLALAGTVLLTASDFHISRQSVMGDIICFTSMLFFTSYLAQGRVSRTFPNIWLYLVPLYAVAGSFCLIVSAFVTTPFTLPAPRDIWCSLGLAVIPTIMGHSALNYAMKHMRGQVVSVVNLFQFLFAGILAFVIFREIPQPIFYVAGALVVSGAVIVIYSAHKPQTPLEDRPLEYDGTAT